MIKELGFDVDDDGDVELKDVSEESLQSSSTTGSDHWTLDSLVPITLPIVCNVPQRIVIFMRSIERHMALQGMSGLEFGVFLKGKFEGGVLNVDPDSHFIPQQKVSGGAIDFEEDPPGDDYNGVVHRHPTGCRQFSGVDAMHINRNFEFSILYEGNNIILGIINVTCGDIRIQLPLTINVQYPVFNIEDADTILMKIKKKSMGGSSSTAKDYRLGKLLTEGDRDEDGILTFEDRDVTQDSFGFDREDDEDRIFLCRHCGGANIIDTFPYACDSCNMILTDDDVEEIFDIGELESCDQEEVVEKLESRKQKEIEVEEE